MTNAEKWLSAKDYENYRKIRSAAKLYIGFGLALALVLAFMASADSSKLDSEERFYLQVVFGVAITSAILGGVGTLLGIRVLAFTIHVFNLVFIVFPFVGITIANTVWCGLWPYLKCLRWLKRQEEQQRRDQHSVRITTYDNRY